jgi:L-seryl-tRNA(Ser) seleniumtransferase
MIARSSEGLHADARRLVDMIGQTSLKLDVEACTSTVGGGAMPTAELPSWAVTIAGKPDELDRRLRATTPPVIATIRDGKLWLDVRTIAEEELGTVAAAVRALR